MIRKVYFAFQDIQSTAYQSIHFGLCHHHQPINVPTVGLLYGLHIGRTSLNRPPEPSAGWWELTTANAANDCKTNGLMCLAQHGGARDSKFLVTHPMTDQHCLISAITCRSALTGGAIELLILGLFTFISRALALIWNCNCIA
jgi:hypothetical protein